MICGCISGWCARGLRSEQCPKQRIAFCRRSNPDAHSWFASENRQCEVALHIDANAVTQDLGVLARETNSKSSYSSSWSFGMKVRLESIGSETNTPPPYSFMCHAASESFGSQATSSTSAGFPWKSTWSPFLISSPDLYFKTEKSMSPPEGKSLAFALFRFPCAEFQKFRLDPNGI